MFDTNFGTNNQGIYLSHQLVDILLLINLDDKNEIRKYIEKTPNLLSISEEEIKKMETYLENNEDGLENVKKELFEKYQQSYINFMLMEDIENDFKYRFHLKLETLNLPIEVENKLFNLYCQKGGEKACYEILEQIIGKESTKKIQLYFMDDYENIKSATYEQMIALNQQIKSNIATSKNKNGSYTLVIGSSRFFNTMITSQESQYIGNYNYEPHYVKRGVECAKRLNANTRFHCLFDCNTAKQLYEEKKYTKEHKEEILKLLKYYTRSSLQEIIKSNENGNVINVIEIFNELVEYNKDDKNTLYQEVWKKYFDINIEEIIEKCIKPNKDLIDQLKQNGVEFMYNETLLQESESRREKIEEVYDKIQKNYPDLIDIFGDQMHFTDSDLTDKNINNLEKEAEFLQKMQNKFKDNGEKLKVECTEFDFGINKWTMKNIFEKIKSGELTNEFVKAQKQNMINKIKEIFRNVQFNRCCDWTTLDNIDCRIVRESKKDNVKLYSLLSGKYSKISSMQKTIEQQQTEYLTEKQEIQEKRHMFYHKETNTKQESFQQSFHSSQQQNKGKMLIKKLNTNSSNHGFVNTLVLAVIMGVIFIMMYMIIN